MGEKFPSSRSLILQHSQARVLVASRKQFSMGIGFAGLPQVSRQMQDEDAVLAMAKKYDR